MTELGAVREADFVAEAITENIEAKYETSVVSCQLSVVSGYLIAPTTDYRPRTTDH